jgi:5'-AMP-activated protein kinase catalytic alpha subunit
MAAAAAASAGSNKQQAGGSSSSSRGDAGSSSSRPSVAEAAAASQQRHQAALRERYELQSLRGKGSFAKVWEARHRRTGLKVAIKIISHAEMLAQGLSTDKIAREIRVMRLLSQGHHPHIIRFYEAMATHAHTYIVMELAESGQLHDHVVLQGRLPEEQARTIFRQLAAAVLFCHRNMVTHRDLKMENVLLMMLPDTAIVVKVVDFGFSKVYTDDKPMRKKMGSRLYAAPELFGGANSWYEGPQVDVWSCGVILYGMLCGGLPFDGDHDISELARNVRRGEYRVPSWVSDDARELIAGMLIVRPSKRMTMAEVMAHRWLRPADMPAYLVMPPPDVNAAAMVVQVGAVEQLVTRHGFDRSTLMESLRGQHHQEDEAAVAYQLVLASMSDPATRYLSMRPPPPEQRQPQWALGGLLDGGVLLHDCPRLTMQRIAAALEELGIPIVSYHRRCHRIMCRADVVVPGPAAADGVEINNDILDSLSAAVFFEIQVGCIALHCIALVASPPY